MKRQIISIDEHLCNGCGNCIPGCPEGALQLIDGKARLVSDLFCDGLGACLGECPLGAITVIEREAEPYSERTVMENIVRQGPGTIRAHLAHLRDHNETGYLNEAIAVLREKGIQLPAEFEGTDAKHFQPSLHSGCPGSQARSVSRTPAASVAPTTEIPSELTQWPIQLHLINPRNPYFADADLVIAADCVAFSHGDFHRRFLKGKKLVIFCPKLDDGIDGYVEKLTELFAAQNIRSIGVLHMEVPCCFGTVRIVEEALRASGRAIPVTEYTIGISGDIQGVTEKAAAGARA